MSFEPKFFRCAHCGQVISVLKDAGVPIVCCGERMGLLTPNTTDAAQEKHVPVAAREGGKLTVKVGSAAHPMLEAHFIEWIYLHTASGGQRRVLAPGEAPEAVFCIAHDALEQDEALEVYAYCNLHGLWMAGA
jgi:superoxide reductase